MVGIELGEAEVVEGEEVELGEGGEEFGIGAVAAGDGEVVQQPRESQVQRGESVAAGLMGERAGEPGFADAARSGDEDVEVLAQPSARRQTRGRGTCRVRGGGGSRRLRCRRWDGAASRGAVGWSCAGRRARWFRGRRAGRDAPRTRVLRRAVDWSCSVSAVAMPRHLSWWSLSMMGWVSMVKVSVVVSGSTRGHAGCRGRRARGTRAPRAGAVRRGGASRWIRPSAPNARRG